MRDEHSHQVTTLRPQRVLTEPVPRISVLGMRQTWFSLLLIATLAGSATASAWAAQACPYKQTAAATAAHDCCPDQQTKPKPTDHDGETMDCQLGQSCRTSHAVEPFVTLLTVAHLEVGETSMLGDQQAPPKSVPSGLWRPPRIV